MSMFTKNKQIRATTNGLKTLAHVSSLVRHFVHYNAMLESIIS